MSNDYTSSEAHPIQVSNETALPYELTDVVPPSETNFIKVNDFRFFYGKKEVLHGVNLEIPSRRVLSLIHI